MEVGTGLTNVHEVLYGLQRASELKRSDPSRYDAERTKFDLFTRVLSSGPEAGIHTILWADSFLGIDCRVGAPVLRTIGLRGAEQMTSGDSRHVVDTASAHRLGSGAAILCDVETRSPRSSGPSPPNEALAGRVIALLAGGLEPHCAIVMMPTPMLVRASSVDLTESRRVGRRITGRFAAATPPTGRTTVGCRDTVVQTRRTTVRVPVQDVLPAIQDAFQGFRTRCLTRRASPRGACVAYSPEGVAHR